MCRTLKFAFAVSIGLAFACIGLVVLHAVAVAIRESGTDLPLWPRAGPYTLIVFFGYLLHSGWFLRPGSKKAVAGRVLMSVLAIPYAAMSLLLVCKFYFSEEELRQAARSKAVAQAEEIKKDNRRLVGERTRQVAQLKSALNDERRTQARQNLELAISLAELELLTPLPEAPRRGIDITSELAKQWGTTPRRYVLYNALATGAVLVFSPYVLLSLAAWMWPRPSESRANQCAANQGATKTELQRSQPESASSTTKTPERSMPAERSSEGVASARAAGSSTPQSRKKRQLRRVENVAPDDYRKAIEKHRKVKTSSSSASQPRHKRSVATAAGPDDLQPASISRQSTTSKPGQLCVRAAELDRERSIICKHTSSRKTQKFNVTIKRTAVWICAIGTAGFLDCIGYWSRGPPVPLLS